MNMQTPSLLIKRRDDIMPNANDVLGRLNGVLSTVKSWMSKGFQLINSIFGSTPIGGMLQKIMDAIQKFVDLVNKLQELVSKLVEIMRGIFMPWILPSYADRWYSISDNYREISAGVGPQGLRAPGNGDWTGQAATQYQRVSATYSQAASFASETASSHGDRLNDLSQKGQALYISIGGLIATIITTIVAVATATGTIVGIPAAVVEAAVAIPGLITEVMGVIQNLMDLSNTMKAETQQIKDAMLSAQQYFPSGSWLPLAQVG